MSDIEIRRAAFAWLGEQVDVHGQVLSREVLGRGFPYKEERIPLVSPQGIFKPRQMELPLSITTVADGPYQDAFGPSLLRYRYRGIDPNHRDNAGLRELIRRREPLIYFQSGYGTIDEDTSTWLPCSYSATLATRPGLTTGLNDRGVWDDTLTFCICGHHD